MCHLGDLGHPLNENQIADIGTVDVLLVPVGGYFTIDAKQATSICQSLKAKVVIPMHYKTTKCGYPISEVDEFLKGKENIRRLNVNEIEYTRDNLPKQADIVVLHHAL